MAEKFSKFRDPGTGIQVFLTPVASGRLGDVLLPVFIVLGVFRVLLGVVALGLYWVVPRVGLRLGLAALGYWRLDVEVRGVGGEVVVANHASWIDLLLLAYLHPGVKFVLPILQDLKTTVKDPKDVKDAKVGNGRRGGVRTNAMSANTRIVTPGVSKSDLSIAGYTTLPLHLALGYVGHLPPTTSQIPPHWKVLPDIQAVVAGGLVVVFPEVVSSNNRALLQLESSLVPASKLQLVSIKYPPPHPTARTAVYSVPQSILRHAAALMLLSSPVRSVTLRTTVTQGDADAVVTALSNLARLKRTAIDWTAKHEFLTIIQNRAKKS